MENCEGLPNPVELVNKIIVKATRDAVDAIHFSPRADSLEVSFRKFGRLTLEEQLPHKAIRPIIDCVKRMSSLDINERALPQDGRVRMSIDGKKLDMLESVVPTYWGEKAVLRFIPLADKHDTFESLGMSEETANSVRKAQQERKGLTLFAGLRHSGLSTTLNAITKELASAKQNAFFITRGPITENSSITHILPAPWKGLTVAACVRSALRADSDLIIVDDIDCYETAEVVIKAAQRGHFIIAAIAAEDCQSTLQRLLDFGICPTWLTHSLKLIVAQTLVTVPCEHCNEKGCESCSSIGATGRKAYFETLFLDRAIHKALRGKSPSEKLRRYFISSNHMPLKELLNDKS